VRLNAGALDVQSAGAYNNPNSPRRSRP